MYKVTADFAKNRIHIVFIGQMEVAEIQAGANEVIAKARSLRKGFGCISEIASFVPTSEEGRMVMRDCMAKIHEMGMGPVVRVTGNKLVAANQWQRTSKSVGYTAEETATLEEAQRRLDQLQAAKP